MTMNHRAFKYQPGVKYLTRKGQKELINAALDTDYMSEEDMKEIQKNSYGERGELIWVEPVENLKPIGRFFTQSIEEALNYPEVKINKIHFRRRRLVLDVWECVEENSLI